MKKSLKKIFIYFLILELILLQPGFLTKVYAKETNFIYEDKIKIKNNVNFLKEINSNKILINNNSVNPHKTIIKNSIKTDDEIKNILSDLTKKIESEFIMPAIAIDYEERVLMEIKQKIISSEIYHNYGPDFRNSLDAIFSKKENKYSVKLSYKDINDNNAKTIYGPEKEITIKYKGIYFNKKNIYNLKTGERIDTKLRFTEGNNDNLQISYSDPNVVKLDKKGILTAQNIGTTFVYIEDKYHKYFESIAVVVNEKDIISSFINYYKNNVIEIDYIDLNTRYNNNDITSVIKDKIYNNKYNLGIMEYGIDKCECDEQKNKCICTVNKFNTSNYETFDVNYKYEGIKLESKFYNKKLNEKVNIKYEIIGKNDNDRVSIKSLNPKVCEIENNEIIAKRYGVCNIEYKSKNHINYQHILFGLDEIKKEIINDINNLQNQIDFKILGYDNISEFELQRLLSSKLNYNYKNNKEYYGYKPVIEIPDYPTKKENINVYGKLDLEFSEEKNTYNYDIKKFLTAEELKINCNKQVNINEQEIEKEYLDLGQKIQDTVPKKYELTFIEYLKSKIDAKFKYLYNYSKFIPSINKITKDVKFIELSGVGAPSYDEHSVIEYQELALIKDERLITIFTTSTTTKLYLQQYNEIITEEEIIELIKQKVKKAYLELKNDITQKNSIYERTSKMNLLKTSYEPNIEVNKIITDTNDLYEIKVDDAKFTTNIGIKYDGKLNYIETAKELNILSKEMKINVGETKNIKYEIIPNNVSTKNVKYISSNSDIVKVSSNGQITGIKEGIAEITLTTIDGSNISKKIKVVVLPQEIKHELKPNTILENEKEDEIIPFSTSLEINKETINKDKTFNIIIKIKDAKNLKGFSAPLIYDRNLIKLESITPLNNFNIKVDTNIIVDGETEQSGDFEVGILTFKIINTEDIDNISITLGSVAATNDKQSFNGLGSTTTINIDKIINEEEKIENEEAKLNEEKLVDSKEKNNKNIYIILIIIIIILSILFKFIYLIINKHNAKD